MRNELIKFYKKNKFIKIFKLNSEIGSGNVLNTNNCVIAILVIGPKDFPFVLRKIGSWIGSTKRYFTDIQQSVTKLDESVDEKISIEEKYSEKSKDENK